MTERSDDSSTPINTRRMVVRLAVWVVAGWQLAISVAQEPSPGPTDSHSATPRTPIRVFLDLTSSSSDERSDALDRIGRNWNDGDSAMLIESARFVKGRSARASIYRALSENTGQALGTNHNDWFRWLWNREIDVHPNYASFKKTLYARIDSRFAEYFDDTYDPQTVVTDRGDSWRVTEDALILGSVVGDSQRLSRMSAHRAFWFGWNAAFPEGELIHSTE